MSTAVLDAVWPAFLAGASVDATDPRLPDRIHSLQVLRMLELLATRTSLNLAIQKVVADRLRTSLEL